MTRVVFADGDDWRELTADVWAAGQATVVTRRGTAVLLDLEWPQPRFLRVPVEGGHHMPSFDCGWLPIERSLLVVTPCGVVLDMP